MEGLLVSCIVTLLFILVMWLEPRRFSGVILLLIAVGSWLMTLTDFLSDKGAAFNKLMLALIVVVVPLTILCTGLYILFYNRASKKDKKKFAVVKSIFFLMIVGIASAVMWILAWFSYTRLEYHRLAMFKRTMEPIDYIIDGALLLFWLIIICFAFSLLGFVIYSALMCKTPKLREYNYIILHGDGKQKKEVDNQLADYLDRAIELKQECCAADSKFMLFGSISPGETISEARMMANYLIENGIEKDCITINENLDDPGSIVVAAKKIIDKINSTGQALMLTRDYMVFRMNLYAKKIKLDMEPVGFKFRDNNRSSNILVDYIIVMMWYKWLWILGLAGAIAGIVALLML